MNNKQDFGFTLTELMMVVAIVGILAAIALPSFQDQFKIRRVKGATAILFGALQNAKAEAIKRNVRVKIAFTPTGTGEHGTWCYGMVESPGAETCDCTAANSCLPGSVVKSTDYKDIIINDNNFSSSRVFSPRRGTASTGTIIISAGPATDNKTLGVTTSGIGRIRICKVTSSTIYTSSEACP